MLKFHLHVSETPGIGEEKGDETSVLVFCFSSVHMTLLFFFFYFFLNKII